MWDSEEDWPLGRNLTGISRVGPWPFLDQLFLPEARDEDVGFPSGSVSKESACKAGDPGLSPGSGRSSGEAHDNPLQNSCLENPMNRGAWWTTVQLTKSRTRLSDFQLQRLRRVAWKGQLRSQDPLFKALHLARKGPKWTREGY